MRIRIVRPFVRSCQPPAFAKTGKASRGILHSLATAGLLLLGTGVAEAQISISGDVTPSPAVNPTWNVGGDLFVGNTSAGNMTVGTGGTVNNSLGAVGTFTGGTGQVTVSGGNWTTTSQLQIGVAGNGTLILTSGNVTSLDAAFLGADAGSTGIATVSGGTFSAPASLVVGNEGNGTLNLSGGTVATVDGFVGGAGGVGVANVTGGTWSHSNILAVGYQSEGTVNLSGGNITTNQVWLAADSASSNGTLNLNGGLLSTRQVTEVLGNGIVSFNGGTLRLTGNQSNLFAGFESGDVRLGGSGGTIDTQAFRVATTLGLTGNGSLTKQGNGTLTLSGNNTHTGGTRVTNGTLAVSGGGAINHSSAGMTVGLNSGDNAIFRLSNGTVSNREGYIGRNSTATGLAEVSGGSWTNSGSLRVGHYGNGTLTISGTGAVSSGGGFIGEYAGSTGTAVVSSGSWTSSGQIEVGNTGNGTLTISGNGAVSNTRGFIATQAGSTGNATVSGGSWTNSGSLSVGTTGDGTLTISGNGSVSASSVSVADSSGSTGTVNLTGGTLSTGQLSRGDGTATVTFNGGTLRLTGNQTFLFSGFNTGDVRLTGAGGTIDTQAFNAEVFRGLAGNGSLTKHGNGTLTLWEASSYTGGTTVANGALRLLNNSAVGTGNITTTGSVISYGNGVTIANPIILNSNDTQLEVLGTDSATQAGAISQTGGARPLGKIGTGTLTLTGNNAYGGNTTIRAGTLVLDGGGSLAYNGAPGFAGLLIVGQSSGDNATFTLGNGTIADVISFVGLDAGSTGTVNINGGTWNANSSMYVGYSGNGTLNMTGGTLAMGTYGTLTLGLYAGGSGIANITGGNLTGSGLNVGNGSNGTLNLSGNGTISVRQAILGNNPNVEGVLNVTGGNLTLTETMTIGLMGNGTLNLSGGDISTKDTVMGSFTLLAKGIANVTGGNWTNSGSFTVGSGSNSTLNISGGQLTTGNMALSIGVLSNSTLNLTGGTLATARISEGSGTGNVTFSGGTLRLTGNQSALFSGFESGDVTLVGSGLTLDTQGFAVAAALGLTGNGSLNKQGNGTLTLTGNNTYTGGTAISSGTLQIGNNGTTGSITGNVANNGTLTFNRSDDLTFGGLISGTGNVTKDGAGTVTLSDNSSSYTGVTTVRNGILSVSRLASGGNNSALGAATSAAENLVLDGGTLRFTDTISWTSDRLFTIGAGGATLEAAGATGRVNFINAGGGIIGFTGSGNRTLVLTGGGNGLIFRRGLADSGSGTTGLTKNGSGTWTWDAIGTSSGNALSYTGPTNVNAGTLIFNYAASGNTRTLNSAVTVAAGAEFRLNNEIMELGSLAGAGTLRVGTSNETLAQLIVGLNNTDTTFSGTIEPLSGFIGTNIGFAKLGNGTMTILSNQTRTGYTFVEDGVLSINTIADGGVASSIGASSRSSGNLLFGNGGTLRYTGGAASTDRLFQLDNGGSKVRTLESSGTGPLNFTNNGSIVNMSGSPAVTFALGGSAGGTFAPGISFNIRFLKLGSGTWTLTGNNTPTGGTTVHNGTLVLSGGGAITHSSANLTVALNSSDNATFTLSNGTVTASSVLAASSSNSTGRIDLNGGLLSTGQVSEGDGNATLTFNGGTLQLTTDQTNLFSGFESGDATLVGAGGTIDTQTFTVATALALTGNGSLVKQGNGTLTLTGNNTYGGDTIVRNGTLALSGGGAISHADADLLVGANPGGNATFNLSDGVVSSRLGFIAESAGSTGTANISGGNWTTSSGLAVGQGGNGTLNVSGGSLTNLSSATLGAAIGATGTANVSGGNWTNTSGIVIGQGASSTGTLNISNGSVSNAFAHLGSFAGATGIANVSGGNWTSDAIQVGGSGNGTLNVSGNGTVSAFSVEVANSAPSVGRVRFTGGVVATTQISEGAGNGTVTFDGGTLRLSADQTTLFSGFETGDVALVASGATIDTQSFTVATALGLTGNGSLTKVGTGTLTLSGNSTYTGNTTISAGRLAVTGSLGTGTVNVMDTATLSGSGSIGGTVIVADGGRLAPGMSPETLSVAGFTLSNNAILDFDLATPGVVGGGINDLIEISGNLTLDGILNIANAGGFGNGTYRLMNYTGNLTNNGVVFGTLPTGLWDLTVDTTTANQVNLLVAAATAQYWDGANTTANGTVDGGTGTWNDTATNWTNAAGNANSAWLGGFGAAFAGTAGNVTLADGFTANATAYDFRVAGYTVSGNGTIDLSDTTPFVTVNGTTAIAVAITGNGTLSKQGNGTLTLTGNNTYSGGTRVRDGNLTVADGGSLTHNATDLIVGQSSGDNAFLTISANSSVSNALGRLGNSANATGTVNVNGGNWTNASSLLIGVLGNGTMNLANGTVSNTSGYLGLNPGTTGVANISGGTWTNTETLNIAENGNGTMNLSNGTVTNTQGFVGRYENTTGIVNVTGGNWTSTGPLFVGFFGNGTLNLSNGEVSTAGAGLGQATSGTGTANVTGGTWTNTGLLTIGDSGTGVFTLANGTVSSGGATLAASTANSTGTAIVTGGTWTNNGSFFIGVAGSGTFTLSNGTVSSTSAGLGLNVGATGTANVTGGSWTNSTDLTIGDSGRGTLNISNGTVSSDNGVVGNFAGSTGNVTVSGGNWTVATQVFVGNGGTGSLSISNGTVSTASATIGRHAGSNGTVTVTGGNFTNSSVLRVGLLGTGRLDVSGGNVSSSETYIASSSGSTGNVTFSGGSWTDDTAIFVGNGGTGSLNISNGTVSTLQSVLGQNFGSTGTANVTGGTWTTNGSQTIGNRGNGTFLLSNGTVTATESSLALNAGSTGTASVSGGNWTVSGTAFIGYAGNGTLNLSNGTFSTDLAYLGQATGATGVANVSGGNWTNSGTLYVGFSGNGTLNVSGGVLSTNSTLLGSFTGASGSLDLTGGILSSGQVAGNQGTGTVAMNGGTLRLTGNQSELFRDLASVTLINAGGSLDTQDFAVATALGLAGNGSLTKLGNGTLTLTGNNTYAGGTVIREGTIEVGGGGTITHAGANLTVGASGNGTLRVLSSGSVSASSLILASGANATGTLTSNGTIVTGGFQKGLGNGSLTFTGGTVRLAGNATELFENFLAGEVLLNDDGVEIDTQAHTVTTALALAGNGFLGKLGTGVLVLSANNTYSGGTGISEGTLRTESRTALGSGPVSIKSGTLDPVGRLDVNSLTWSGGTIASELGTSTDLLSLSGNLTLSGGGNFTFTAGTGFALNVPYTILSAPNLVDSMLASFRGNALLGILPTFLRDGLNLLVRFTTISAGTTIQNTAPIYTPDDANFIVTGAARTGSPTENNTIRSLTFNPETSLLIFNILQITSGNVTVPTGNATITGGLLSTPGGFNKNGSGLLSILANLLANGPSFVNGGGLFINGTFQANGGLTVLQNALLGGNGTIFGDVFNFGTVNTGNSPGTLSIAGNFTQASSGTLALEIASPTVFDRLVVSGTANLAGTLAVQNLGTSLAYGQQYAFLQADSISGSFDQISMPQSNLYRGRFLTDGGTGTLLVAPTSYTLVAQTQNQRNVAKALDSFIPATSGDRLAVSTALDLQSAEQYPAAFDQIAPGFYQSLGQIAISQAFTQTQMINQRLSSVRLGARGFQAIGLDEQPLKNDKDGKSTVDPKDAKTVLVIPSHLNWSAWAMGTGIFGKSQGLAGVPNFRSQSGGFLAGADYAFGTQEPGRPALTTGFFGGYSYTAAQYAGGSDLQANSALFGLYATYSQGGFYADAVLGGGYTSYRASRSIEFSSVDRTARSTPDGGQFSAALNLGHDWKAGGFTFGPIAGLQYIYAGIAPFNESGADSLDLSIGRQNANSLQMTLGGRVAYTWNITRTISLIPEARLFWQHEFLNDSQAIAASFQNGPAFDFLTDSPNRDSVFAGAGLSAQFGERWNGFLFYNTGFGSQQSLNHSVSAGLGWKF